MKSSIARLFRRLSLGVYVVGVNDQGRTDAFTASSVMQASYRPLLLAVSVNPEHASYPLLRASRHFAVSVLRSDQLGAARHFGTRSGAARDKLRDVAWRGGANGAPILEDAIGWFECELAAVMPAGDHQIVLGRVTDGRLVDPDACPLLYRETSNLDGSSRLFPEHYS